MASSLAKPIIFFLAGLVCIGTLWKQWSIAAQDTKEQIEAIETERTILRQRLSEAQNLQLSMGKDLKAIKEEMSRMKTHMDTQVKKQTEEYDKERASFQEDLLSCQTKKTSLYKDWAILDKENSNIKQELLVAKEGRDVDKWEMEELPIMKSISRGFHPVYVYSMATPELRKDSYAQVKQDVLVHALTKAIHAKLEASNTTNVATVEAMDMAYQSMDARPFFVDLGANDAIKLSNTYLLESLGWNGLCVEPDPQYWYGLASFRKCAIVGGRTDDGDEVDDNLTDGKTGGIRGKGVENQDVDGDGGVLDVKEINKRNLVSLLTVFKETNVPKSIDYLSLNVEWAKSLLLDNFPWNDYTFKFLTVVVLNKELTKVLNSKGYKQVRNLSALGETLWIHNASVRLSQEEIDTVAASVGAEKFE
ncbi:hypothetical protein ACHAXR_002577 [Thalassiosira sp. AJA248-18]